MDFFAGYMFGVATILFIRWLLSGDMEVERLLADDEDDDLSPILSFVEQAVGKEVTTRHLEYYDDGTLATETITKEVIHADEC